MARLKGTHAILGVDIVSFSELHNDDQIETVNYLIKWIKEGLAHYSISEDDFRWSPAGDGGYLTFDSHDACSKAIDIVFSICEKVSSTIPAWIPRNGHRVQLRWALHSGPVVEGTGLKQENNIWGLGINVTSRILSIAAPSQLLISKQYFDTYIKEQREDNFVIGPKFWRTVKHGRQVEVLNVDRNDVCLNKHIAQSIRWNAIGALWHKTTYEYQCLLKDTMMSDDPIASIAVATFLLNLNNIEEVKTLCKAIGDGSGPSESCPYPRRSHSLFSLMPPKVLFDVIKHIKPRYVKSGEIICGQGEKADSCYFVVSGDIIVMLPNIKEPIPIPPGELIGEFGLWIPNIKRTATVEAITDGLILEIRNDKFNEVLDEVNEVRETIFSMIKRRIIENVLKSSIIFPGLGKDEEEDSSRFASCKKYKSGSILNLRKNSYILFNGIVQINTNQGLPIQISAFGDFGTEQIVGLVNDLETIDGEEAIVLEETAVVIIEHKKILELQKKYESILFAWDALCGQRSNFVKRQHRRGEC